LIHAQSVDALGSSKHLPLRFLYQSYYDKYYVNRDASLHDLAAIPKFRN
jgi:hypothetical protein